MKIVADLHVHTVASGHAYSTVYEIASVAARKGLKMVALTDHGPGLPGGPHPYHFSSMRLLPREIEGVQILHGVEANITDYDGNLDLPERYLKKLDIVLAGFHDQCYPGGTVNDNTRAIVNAMKNPYVDIIVHPGNPEFPIDALRVCQAAKDYGVCLELNNGSLTVSRHGSTATCLEIARWVGEQGIMVSLSSDAHFMSYVGEVSEVRKMAEEAGIDETQVLNASVERVWGYLKARRKGQ